jgi:ElaB/YqjD/DUF883 family membrane-anchored ribosome-binding protein
MVFYLFHLRIRVVEKDISDVTLELMKNVSLELTKKENFISNVPNVSNDTRLPNYFSSLNQTSPKVVSLERELDFINDKLYSSLEKSKVLSSDERQKLRKQYKNTLHQFVDEICFTKSLSAVTVNKKSANKKPTKQRKKLVNTHPKR